MAVTSDEGSPAPAASTSKQQPAPSAKSTAFASGVNAPPGFGLRRSKTMDETAPLRRTSFTSRSDMSADGLQRRNSNFSDYSLNEARNILNPRPSVHSEQTPESSSLASLSLAFALLPAIAGALFKNGSSVVTDIMLLGLAGIFLHWSVTQPWYVHCTHFHGCNPALTLLSQVMVSCCTTSQDRT